MSTSIFSANEQAIHGHEGSLDPDSTLRLATKFAFAVVTILGGIVVGTGEMTSLHWVLAFFSVVGFVFVDWLKLFSLPSVIAYAAMIVAAVYCVSDFAQLDTGTSNKMKSVAELLVIAQSILMLQTKNQRLFEQLFVFAVLNCVVAAVFNDAFSYATWLIPLTIASGVALTLLAADATAEQTAGDAVVATTAAVASVNAAGFRASLFSLMAVFPAILLFASCFFFGLPRNGRAARGNAAGTPMIGYSDELRLEQIGQMQQSSETALRVWLCEADTGRSYPVIDGIYLRGRVLERYRFNNTGHGNEGTWQALAAGDSALLRPLPKQYIAPSSNNDVFADHVDVTVECEHSRSSTLFSIAPFHLASGNDPVQQVQGRWELKRSTPASSNLIQRFPKMSYTFGTVGFSGGIQSILTPYQSANTEPIEPTVGVISIDGTPADLDYVDAITEDPTRWIPTAKSLSNELIGRIRPEQRNDYSIARGLEQYLAGSGDFQYTLNLNANPQPDVDPIEQFLANDRRGHCQFFASALVLMLRTQKIPARIVVGYRTDEFNDLTNYFIVRQAHAHAWVEALIPKDVIPKGQLGHGQMPSSHYWLRLDPTPGGGGINGAGGNQMLDMAKNLWDNYVVELDPNRQRRSLLATPGLTPMTQSYRSWIDSLQDLAIRINAGEVEGLRSRPTFSFGVAISSILLCLAAVVAFRLKLPQWLHRRLINRQEELAPRPSLPFYAEALDLFAQFGKRRRTGQTPREFLAAIDPSSSASDSSTEAPNMDAAIGPLGELTSAFYDLRYSRSDVDSNVAIAPWKERIDDALEELRKHTK